MLRPTAECQATLGYFFTPFSPAHPRVPGTVVGSSVFISCSPHQQPYEAGVHLFKDEETRCIERKQLLQCPQLGFNLRVLFLPKSLQDSTEVGMLKVTLRLFFILTSPLGKELANNVRGHSLWIEEDGWKIRGEGSQEFTQVRGEFPAPAAPLGLAGTRRLAAAGVTRTQSLAPGEKQQRAQLSRRALITTWKLRPCKPASAAWFGGASYSPGVQVLKPLAAAHLKRSGEPFAYPPGAGMSPIHVL